MIGVVAACVVGSALALGYFAAARRLRARGSLLDAYVARRANEVLSEDPVQHIVETSHRGLPVTLGFGVPEEKEWAPGLVARAAWAIGRGPSFVAAPRDVTAHTRRASATYPLRARLEHGYHLTGQHREARALLSPVLEAVKTPHLPAPYFSASHGEVWVYLPEYMPEPNDPDALATLDELVALTGELALFGEALLLRYATQLEGKVVIDRKRAPRVSTRFVMSGVESVLEVAWQPPRTSSHAGVSGVFVLRISTPSGGGHALDVQTAIRALATRADRELAEEILARSELQLLEDRVVLATDSVLEASELTVATALLGHLAGHGQRAGPFR